VSALQLAAIYRYPLKSAAGESLTHCRSDRFGLVGDRRWLLVDEQGGFVTQRSLAALCLLRARSTADGLLLSFAGSAREVPRPAADAARMEVRVWGDAVTARCADAGSSAWIADCLQQPLRLVYMPDDARRPVDPDYARGGETVSFADGFPLLVLSSATLDELNRRLPRPVPVDRFRPNLVIAGAEPHAEDSWRRLRIGSAEIELVKPCSRCAVPSIDQASGGRDPHINRVLAEYRRRDGQIFFGMNGLVAPGQRFSEGDAVRIIA
jgi:uncharacterized protein YcbX